MKSRHILILTMALAIAYSNDVRAQDQTQTPAAAPALPTLPVNPADASTAKPQVAATAPTGSSGGAPVSTSIAKFSEAEAEAEKIKGDQATQKYLKGSFYPTFSGRYSSVLKECFSQPKASKDPFTIVLALDKEGHVEAINLDTTTTISDCMMKSLTLDTFGPPPFVPFHIKVKMQFK